MCHRKNCPYDSQDRFERSGVSFLREFGCFVALHTLQAGKFDITARRILLQTGSQPAIALIPGLQDLNYLTNGTFFRLNETLDHLIIQGGGPISVEMAQAYALMVIEVTLIEVAQILARDDPELVDFVWRRL